MAIQSKTRKEKNIALAISIDTYNAVYERDNGCVLCQRLGVPKNYVNLLECHHFVPRSKLGMGIEENLVMLCKIHHMQETKYRSELEQYMKEHYDNWNKDNLVYKKWS